MLVSKKKREMVLLRGESVLRTYRIALGREPVGPKRQEGDGRTPEGRYTIDWRNAKSKYHLSLHISYPDAADVARAREAGVDPGGDIMIHGLPDGVAEGRRLDAGLHRGDGRGDGRNLGTGGGGDADLDRGMRKRWVPWDRTPNLQSV